MLPSMSLSTSKSCCSLVGSPQRERIWDLLGTQYLGPEIGDGSSQRGAERRIIYGAVQVNEFPFGPCWETSSGKRREVLGVEVDSWTAELREALARALVRRLRDRLDGTGDLAVLDSLRIVVSGQSPGDLRIQVLGAHSTIERLNEILTVTERSIIELKVDL